MVKLSFVLALGAMLVVSSSVARAAQSTPVPDTKPDLGTISFLLGTWSCRTMARGLPRPDTMTYTMEYDGRWMRAHDVAPPFDRYRTRAIVSESWITFNPDLHVWAQTGLDNFGGYGVLTSPGWKGNTMTWSTVVTPDGSTGTDLFTKLSDTETKDVYSGRDRNGRPLPATPTICTKK